jgi:hypothetical protein
VVRYLKDSDGNEYEINSYGTRTNDGFVYQHKRLPNDHNIVKVINRYTKLSEYLKDEEENN